MASLVLALASLLAFRQQIREQVTVNAVQIRVVAVNAAGATVEDLAPSDLTLRVDGRVVPIDALAIERSLELPLTASPTTDEQAAAGAMARTPAAPLPAASVMIVVDEATTNFLPVRKEALEQLREFVGKDPRASRYLVASCRLGSLRLDLPWTSDREQVLSVLAKLRNRPTVQALGGTLTSQSSLLEFQMIRARFQTALMQALAMFPDAAMTKQLLIVTGGQTLAPILDVAEAPEKDVRVSGPRLASGGETVPDPGATDAPAEPFGKDFELWSLAVSGALAQGDNRALEAKAIERDVALIPIAASRLQSVGYGDVASKFRPKASGLSAQLATNQALWGLAQETGGGSLILAGKAASELALRSERAGYLMSFRYGGGEAGRFHRIQLTSNRSGVSLEYRRGFRIRTAQERMLDTVFANFVLATDRENDLALSASLTPAGKDGSHTLLTLRFSPPAGSGAAGPRTVEVVAVGKGADGSWTQPARWTGEASASVSGNYEMRVDLAIAPGSRVWSIGLRDTLTSLDGYATAQPPKR